MGFTFTICTWHIGGGIRIPMHLQRRPYNRSLGSLRKLINTVLHTLDRDDLARALSASQLRAIRPASVFLSGAL